MSWQKPCARSARPATGIYQQQRRCIFVLVMKRRLQCREKMPVRLTLFGFACAPVHPAFFPRPGESRERNYGCACGLLPAGEFYIALYAPAASDPGHSRRSACLALPSMIVVIHAVCCSLAWRYVTLAHNTMAVGSKLRDVLIIQIDSWQFSPLRTTVVSVNEHLVSSWFLSLRAAFTQRLAFCLS